MKILEIIFSKKIVVPIMTIIISCLLYRLLKSIVNNCLKLKTRKNDARRKSIVDLVVSVIKYFIIIISILIILDVFGIDTKALVTSLGVISLVAGLALQDILKDFVSGVGIVIEEQYDVGDIVEINGFKGEVLSLNLKTTRLAAYSGEIRIIPNHLIGEVTNFSKNKSLAIIDVSISYESDVDKAIIVLKKMCANYKNKKLLEPLEVLGVQRLNDSSIDIRIIGNAKPMEHFEIEREVRKQVKDILDKNKITIPYPQLVIHNGK